MGLQPARSRLTGRTTFIRSQAPLPHNMFRLIARLAPPGGPFMEESIKVNKEAESRQARPYPSCSLLLQIMGGFRMKLYNTMLMPPLWSLCAVASLHRNSSVQGSILSSSSTCSPSCSLGSSNLKCAIHKVD